MTSRSSEFKKDVTSYVTSTTWLYGSPETSRIFDPKWMLTNFSYLVTSSSWMFETTKSKDSTVGPGLLTITLDLNDPSLPLSPKFTST